MKKLLPLTGILLLVSGALAACTSAQVTPNPEVTEPPQVSEAPTEVPTEILPSPTVAPTPAEPAEVIYYDGVVITIEESLPVAEAIALRGGLIQAVGTDEEMLALKGAETKVIDLKGRTLMPGFFDGHTHLLAFPSRQGKTMEDAQQEGLRYGITSVSEMWANEDQVNSLLQAEREGKMRMRVNVFASYNDGILDGNRRRVLLKAWFPAHGPILDPERRVRIPGIKLFVDGDNTGPQRGCWALSAPFEPTAGALQRGACGTTSGDLYWEQDELNQVVRQATEAGYRAAFHAMGDRAIETALNAIEYGLNGRPNAEVRHQIEHNSLARPDLLERYAALDVLASVRGYGVTFCDLEDLKPAFGEARYLWYLNRFVLAGMDIHTYIETDFGWTVSPDDRTAIRSLDPIMQIYGIVTHNFVNPDGSLCKPKPDSPKMPVSVEKALRMLTIEPAYAVSMEDYVGSLKPGKYADLIILSGNPLRGNPTDIRNIRVWMTMVGGEVQFCDPLNAALCP